MKKTKKYLSKLPASALARMLESLEALKRTGEFLENDNSGLRFVASCIEDEIGIFDPTGKAAELVRDEVCRRFLEKYREEEK